MKEHEKEIMEYLRALLEVAIKKCPDQANRSVWLNGRTLDDIKTAYEEYTNYIMEKESLNSEFCVQNKANIKR